MLTTETLQQLAGSRDAPCVSIFSPTHDSGAEAEGDPIWLKTGLQQAEKRLRGLDIESGQVERVLEPGREFHRGLTPNDYGAGTLAIFLADGFRQILHTPVQTEGNVYVSDRFHLKPLLPVLTDNAHFYVLGVSQHHVRLLSCTRYAQLEKPLSHQQVPQHIAEVVPDIQPKQSVQQHTTRPRAGEGGGHEVVFHGHGKETTVAREELLQFFRRVSEGIEPAMNGSSPLIFAGVGSLFPLYREASSYEHLLDEHISGSPDHMRSEELRERAWELIEPSLTARIADARERYEALQARGQASDDLKSVVLAARDGRAATVIGAADRSWWGRVPDAGDEVQMRAEPEPMDYDLVDYAAVRTMLSGGTALMVPAEEVPGEGRGAAVLLRY